MPTYEYRCTDCGHRFEELQKISEDPIRECPRCSGRTERLISGGAGLLFKGEGFYITDYRSEDYKKAAKKEDKPKAPSAGDAAPTGDSAAGGDPGSGSDKSSGTSAGRASE